LRHVGEYEQAIEHATVAIELEPGPRCYAMRGMSYEELGQFDKALADYTSALEIAGDLDPRVYLLRGTLHSRRNNVPSAIADLEQAVRLLPRESVEWSKASQILRQLRNSQQ
jgi:tetratricopeptide (TPR) repeat protein